MDIIADDASMTAERPRSVNFDLWIPETQHADPKPFRQVGVALKHLPSATGQPNARYNSDTVPWQRVINSKGVISPR
jgi:hypothetical protein